MVNYVTGEGVTGSEAKQKAAAENYVFNTSFALRDFAGVSDIESVGSYVKTQVGDPKRATRQKVYEAFVIVFI